MDKLDGRYYYRSTLDVSIEADSDLEAQVTMQKICESLQGPTKKVRISTPRRMRPVDLKEKELNQMAATL